jgi:hypothetical protein
MNQPCLAHANVHECAEFDDIQNIATQFHARHKLVDGKHRLAQDRWLMVKPWITSRTGQQAHHIVQAGGTWQRTCQFAQLRRLTKAIVQSHQVELTQPRCQGLANLGVRQFGRINRGSRQNAASYRIAFRMYPGAIEWLTATIHLQETCRQFKSKSINSRNFTQLFAGTVALAGQSALPSYQFARKHRVESTGTNQKKRIHMIDFATGGTNRAFNHLV